MSKIKITVRFLMLLVVIFIIYVGMTVYSVLNMGALEQTTVNMYNHPFTVTTAVKDIQIEIESIQLYMMSLYSTKDFKSFQELTDKINEADLRIQEVFNTVYDRFLGDQQMIDDAKFSYDEWSPMRVKIIDLLKSGKHEDANLYSDFTEKNQVELIEKHVSALNEYSEEQAVGFFKKASTDANTKINTTVVVAIVSGIFGIFIGTLTLVDISKSFKRVISRFEEVAKGEGDLTSRLTFKGRDEFAQISVAFNKFTEKIQILIQSVKENVETVVHASGEIEGIVDSSNESMGEIADSFDSISKTSQDTAEIAEKSSLSIEEIVMNSKTISNDSEETFGEISVVLEAAIEGAKSIQSVVEINQSVESSSEQTFEQMRQLKHLTDQIGHILDIITGISEQTNLLALNASIEAARAGKAGRGFAVVANEIRKLAEQSRDSSNQISQLLVDIQSQTNQADHFIVESSKLVKESVDQARNVDGKFTEILNLIETVSEKIKSMNDASSQQVDITSEMSVGIDKLAIDAHSNASAIQEINAVIEEQVSVFEIANQQVYELKEIADKLELETKKFKV